MAGAARLSISDNAQRLKSAAAAVSWARFARNSSATRSISCVKAAIRASSSAMEKVPSGSPTVTGAAGLGGFSLSSSQSMRAILIDPRPYRKGGFRFQGSGFGGHSGSGAET